MGAVSKILERKGKLIFSISPATSVFKALEIMVEKNVSALLVTEADKLVGLFSEKDYARKVMLKGKASKQTKIGEIMTDNVIFV